jgi:hypothetical protein
MGVRIIFVQAKSFHIQFAIVKIMSRFYLSAITCLLIILLVGLQSLSARIHSDPYDFETDVLPILDLYCLECHGSAMPEAGLRLDSAAAILKGGDGGPAIVPGQSAKSLLYQVLQGDEEFRMPPEGEPVPDEEVEVIRAWIDQGAKS